VKKAKEPRKGGTPRFVPTDDERALVKFLAANGYAQHLICKYIANRRGSHISESTLKRVFVQELELGQTQLDLLVLTQFMAAIKRGERWAICKYIGQRMWTQERGGWRARPYEVAVGGAQPAASGGSDLPPVQLIVQFVKPDPSKRQSCPVEVPSFCGRLGDC
jgi:hypothetical protein